MSLMDVSETAPEPWVAMGYFSLNSKRFPRAVYFAQKVQMWTHVMCTTELCCLPTSAQWLVGTLDAQRYSLA